MNSMMMIKRIKIRYIGINPNIPNLNSLNSQIMFHILEQESFLFGIAMDGILGKEIVLSTSSQFFKPLFLCFQETDNGTNDARNPCNVTLPNHKYFQKRMDPNTPGCRGLYLGYHVPRQALLEENSYIHLVSLTTYSLWNHSKCYVENVYIPIKETLITSPICILLGFHMASESH